MAASSGKTAFSNWKYQHYFTLTEVRGKNVYVQCTLCRGTKRLSTSVVSNSNLLKHLSTSHAKTKLVAKSQDGSDINPNSGGADVSLGDTQQGDEGPMPSKQRKLDFSDRKLVTQSELNKVIARYVVENMLPLSTVESDSFRAIIALIPTRAGVGPPCRKTFSKYIDTECTKMNAEQKKKFDELEYVSTTADIWTDHNKSYLGVTAHWINPHNMERGKAALACRRFKGRHTHDCIAAELDSIHSSFGITHKITATITDNGSNFVKAFKKYQAVEDEAEVEDEVTFTDINDALQNSEEDVEDEIILPPHQRCASHTLNLVSCTDIDRWLLSRPETKAVYRSATAKCTGLWNKASRSTVAAETVDNVIGRKLLVPCSTRWNSFYDAMVRISEIPVVELNTLSSRFGLTAISERELKFIREYCTVMKPLTVALDILQGEENCFFGTLLPTLETLMMKTMELKNGLQILVDLPEAIVMVRMLSFFFLIFFCSV